MSIKLEIKPIKFGDKIIEMYISSQEKDEKGINMSKQNKTEMLGSKPIGKLLASYSIPAVIAMMVNAIYNVVDRIFIGQYAGEAALAGLTIVFPAMMVIFAFAGLIGQGSASLISIRLGEKKLSEANNVFSNMIFLSTLVSLTIAGLMYFNLDSVLKFFGATAEIMPHAYGYMSIILIGIVFQLTSFSLTGIVRSEGMPMLSMVSMITSALMNIALDYIFIARFGWGAQGAALATIIGQMSGFIILSQHFIRGNSQLKLQIKGFRFNFKIIGEILTVGATMFLSTVGTSVAMLALNKSLNQYGGLAAVTSMGAINSLFTIFIMPVFGLQQGMQPIIGYNHGAGLSDRVKKTLIYGMGTGIAFSSLVFVVLQYYPSVLMSMFLDPSSVTMNVAVEGLKIFTLALPIVSVNLLGTSYFQSIAAGKKALFLGASRQFLFLLPLVLILPQTYGLAGVWYATPISDVLAVIATLLLLIPSIRAYSDGEKKIATAS